MKIKTVLIFAISLTALSSCKKEGCIDADATNYNADAKKDDGTCSYEGNVVIWYGETAANALVADGATSLTYYVDGAIVGSSAANIYWTGAPDCGANASITVTEDLGGVKTQSIQYSVKDQTGFEYWTGNLNFNANECKAVELTW